MRKSFLTILSVMLVIVAACSDPSGDPGDGTTVPDSQAEAVLLSYSLTAGTDYTYDLEVTQNIVMTAEGNGSSLGEEDFPGSADIEMTARGTITYTVADGTKPNTYEVTITGSFDDVTATGTVDGEDIESGEVPDFAEIQPVEMTLIVDEQGNIIPDELGADPTAGLLGGMENLTDLPGANLAAQFFGPPFGDEPVTVGQAWTTTNTTPGPGDEPTVTTTEGRVTGIDAVDGVEVFVVESTSETSPVEFDLAEFFVGLFSGFMPASPAPEEQEELQALIDGLRFAVSVDGARANSTTLFDPVTGVAHNFESQNSSNVAMDINFPDEATGELVGFVMEMKVDQSSNLRLVSAPNA